MFLFAKTLGRLCGIGLLLAPGWLHAGARHFSFLYEAVPSAAGSVEIENWVTFKTGDNGGRFSAVEFRHELELGITRQFQLGLYVADWDYHSALPDQRRGFAYSGTAVEAIYNLTSPVADPIGLSMYEEIKAGDRFLASESKVILQKNFGRIIAACNGTLEAIWEGSGLEEREAELQNSLGVSYEISQALSVGVELVQEIILPDWRSGNATSNFFAGPNVSVRKDNWFTTVTALAQATQSAGEPDLQLRAIVGYAF